MATYRRNTPGVRRYSMLEVPSGSQCRSRSASASVLDVSGFSPALSNYPRVPPTPCNTPCFVSPRMAFTTQFSYDSPIQILSPRSGSVLSPKGLRLKGLRSLAPRIKLILSALLLTFALTLCIYRLSTERRGVNVVGECVGDNTTSCTTPQYHTLLHHTLLQRFWNTAHPQKQHDHPEKDFDGQLEDLTQTNPEEREEFEQRGESSIIEEQIDAGDGEMHQDTTKPPRRPKRHTVHGQYVEKRQDDEVPGASQDNQYDEVTRISQYEQFQQQQQLQVRDYESAVQGEMEFAQGETEYAEDWQNAAVTDTMQYQVQNPGYRNSAQEDTDYIERQEGTVHPYHNTAENRDAQEEYIERQHDHTEPGALQYPQRENPEHNTAQEEYGQEWEDGTGPDKLQNHNLIPVSEISRHNLTPKQSTAQDSTDGEGESEWEGSWSQDGADNSRQDYQTASPQEYSQQQTFSGQYPGEQRQYQYSQEQLQYLEQQQLPERNTHEQNDKQNPSTRQVTQQLNVHTLQQTAKHSGHTAQGTRNEIQSRRVVENLHGEQQNEMQHRRVAESIRMEQRRDGPPEPRARWQKAQRQPRDVEERQGDHRRSERGRRPPAPFSQARGHDEGLRQERGRFEGGHGGMGGNRQPQEQRVPPGVNPRYYAYREL